MWLPNQFHITTSKRISIPNKMETRTNDHILRWFHRLVIRTSCLEEMHILGQISFSPLNVSIAKFAFKIKENEMLSNNNIPWLTQAWQGKTIHNEALTVSTPGMSHMMMLTRIVVPTSWWILLSASRVVSETSTQEI